MKTVFSNLLQTFSRLSLRQSLRRPGISHIKQSHISNENNSCDLLVVRQHHNTSQAYIFYTINNSTKTEYSADKDVEIDTTIFLYLCNDHKNADINRLSNKFIHLTQTQFISHRKDYVSIIKANRLMLCRDIAAVYSDNNKKHIKKNCKHTSLLVLIVKQVAHRIQ